MQITLNLPPDLEQDLVRKAVETNTPLQTLILEALRQNVQMLPVPTAPWPNLILSYEGSPDFPPLESYRGELLAPPEPKLF